jgi:hypothetical protein
VGEQEVQLVSPHAVPLKFFTCLGFGFPFHQRFCLGEEVREQQLMMGADWVVGLDRHQEIRRDKLCSLVEKLEKSMLTICSRFPRSPTRGIADLLFVTIHPFIAFHVSC